MFSTQVNILLIMVFANYGELGLFYIYSVVVDSVVIKPGSGY